MLFCLQVLAKLHKNTNLEQHRKSKNKLHKKLKSVEIISNVISKNSKKQLPVVSADLGDVVVVDKSNKENSEPSSTDLPAAQSEEEIIRSACDIHEELCDACYIAEEYFSVVMLTIITIGFLIIVFNAYYVLEVTFRNQGDIDSETLSFIIFLVYQMFIHGLGLICIVQNSSAVSEEVRYEIHSTYIHIHKFI